MRLYLDAISKNKISYTPDWISVQVEDKFHCYDIQGWTDYSEDGLHCRTKGDLFLFDDNSEQRNLTNEDLRELKELFSNPKACFNVGVYPANSLYESIVDNDTLTDCIGCLEIIIDKKVEEFEFTFTTECYY